MIGPDHLPPPFTTHPPLFVATIGRLTMAFDHSWEPWHETFVELRPFETPTGNAPDVLITCATEPPRGTPHFSTRGIALVFDQLEHPTAVRVHSSRPTPPSVVLKILCACLVPRKAGLFLHGALLARDNQGILLTGTSGSGKSTLAKLWMQRSSFCGSDEAVIVHKCDGNWHAYPTPFWGAVPPVFTATPHEYKITAHYSLIPPGFPSLMKCVFSGDVHANELSLQHAAAFLGETPPSFLSRQRDIIDRMNILERSLSCCD